MNNRNGLENKVTEENSTEELEQLQNFEQLTIDDADTMGKRGDLLSKVVREFFLDHKVNVKGTTAETSASAATEQDDKNSNSNSHANANGEENTGKITAEMEDQIETPMSKATRNPLVIKNIVLNLSASYLLSCRLVNKLWLDLCTKHMSKSLNKNANATRIRFRYCDETGSHIKNYNGLLRGQIKTLDSFNQFLTVSQNLNSFPVDETRASCSSWSFPCKNYEFNDLVLGRPEIVRFFELQGPEIKGLQLSFLNKYPSGLDPVSAESFTEFFMNKVPNVECLTLHQIPFKWRWNARHQTQILNINNKRNSGNSGNHREIGNGAGAENLPTQIFSLTRLKRLSIDLGYFDHLNEKLVEDIILSSPALQEIDVKRDFLLDKTQTFDYFTSISKTPLLRQVDIRPERKNWEILKKLAQSQPQPRFNHLDLSLEFVDNETLKQVDSDRSISFESFLPLAASLLEASKESLETFYSSKGSKVTKFLKNGIFPCPTLENVGCVGLYCRESDNEIGSSLPVKTFNRIFPNARAIWLKGERVRSDCLFVSTSVPNSTSTSKSAINDDKSNGKTGVIPQVTFLSLEASFTKEFWLNLPYTFCNVEKLFLHHASLHTVLPLVWKLTGLRLKHLELQIPIDIVFWQKDHTPTTYNDLDPTPIFLGFELDAAFTGFPAEACAELLAMYPEILDEDIVKAIRINGSILDLKYLEQLHINFWINRNDELPENVLTVVSGAYAFQPMELQQQLQVGIKTELACGEPCGQTSHLISQNQKMEKILQPLSTYANILYTMWNTINN